MKQQLTILVTPLNAVGHVNACTGALAPLLRRGHRIIFILEEAFSGKVKALGFEEHLMYFPKVEAENPGENPAKLLFEAKVMGNYSAYEKFQNMLAMLEGENMVRQFEIQNQAIEEAIRLYSPDLIYYDAVALYPAIHYSGIPWVKHMSTTPLYYLLTDQVPPGCSGLPSSEANSKEARHFNELRHKYFHSKKYNDSIERMGYERFPNDQLYPESQALNVYGYPDELDYPYVRSLGWFNLEVFNKSSEVIDLAILLPEQFLNDTLDGTFSGCYIYISMGSMGSIDLDLMTRLTSALGRTNHKYIVSKGPRHEEYDLPRNMWGQRFLPQTKIVSQVDLVITHGGNNTVTETFVQGKPMIVVPLFGDQFENAQRLQETGFGRRIAYDFKAEDLIGAVESLLNDKALNEKLQAAAKRIQSTDRHEELVGKIEQLCAK